MKIMVRRLGLLVGAQVAIFGIITGYDQLAAGVLQRWFSSQGWSTNNVIALYWTVPIALYITSEALGKAVDRGWKPLYYWFVSKRIARAANSMPKRHELLQDIVRARHRGLLTKDEVALLHECFLELVPLDLQLLALLDDPRGWILWHGAQVPDWESATYMQLVEFALPQLKGQRKPCRDSIERLYSKKLVLIEAHVLSLSFPRQVLLQSATTPFGHKAAHFVMARSLKARVT